MPDWYSDESEMYVTDDFDDPPPEGSILLLANTRGVYVPQHFIGEVRPECLHGVEEWAKETLRAGPETEGYWEAWEHVLHNARVLDPATGKIYYVCTDVWQDGDCWLVPLTR